MLSAEELGTLGGADFVAKVGGVYEKSPWIAERAHAQRSTAWQTLREVDLALWDVVAAATEAEQLGLLNAHPDLAGKAALAGELTEESTEEQQRAGLSSLTPAEMDRFTSLNTAYRAKFGFPFILAVRNATKRAILCAFERRLGNQPGAELAACLAQVRKIAWMRLRAIATPAPTGFLTCHVLDTAQGCPAAGMAVTLRRLDGGSWGVVGRFVTNSDGRLDGPALKKGSMLEGQYEWTFGVGEYFSSTAVPVAGTPFLADVPLRFGIDDPEAHYHVPLLCSPWSYSTYRGS